MINKFFLCPAFLCCFLATGLKAEAQNIIDELETRREGEGAIRIVCDPGINELLGTPPANFSQVSDFLPADESLITRVVGYRVQIYMDNSPKAKNEAARIESLFNDTFPDVKAYVIYSAPNWKVLAGDFRTKKEAVIFQQTIQSSLPELGKEMYVVPSKINLRDKNKIIDELDTGNH